MSKITKPWEASLSGMIPYLSWGGLAPKSRCCWTTARHSNTCFEMHIILEGSCCLAFDEEIRTMPPGQAVMIAPNVYHAPSHVLEPFCRFSISFSADPALMPALGAIQREGYRFFDPGSRLVALAWEIIRELDENDFLAREMVSALFSQLMVLALRRVRSQEDTGRSDDKALSQEDEIERIDNFFALYPREEQTRQALAEYLHCSERQLIRKIQALYGVSFRQKLITSRMDLAKYLLRTTDQSISQISTATGYGDNAAFFRAFRQYTGMTPTQYRKEKRKGIQE